MPKSIYKKFLQRIKVYRISTSLILFFTFVLSLLVIFSSIEYSNLQEYPVDRDSVTSNEWRDQFYDDGSLEQKVNLYRKALLKNSNQIKGDDFIAYRQPSPTYITINVNDLFDFDEKTSSIYARGTIKAEWDDDSVQNFEGNPSDFLKLNLIKRTKQDVLSTTELNFYDSENQIYKKIALNNSNKNKVSLYSFSGRFKVEEDFRRFPFDQTNLRIILSSRLNVPDIYLWNLIYSDVYEDAFRHRAFFHIPVQCYTDDWYEDSYKDENGELPKWYGCAYDKFRVSSSTTNAVDNDDNLSSNSEFNDALEKLNFYPNSILELTLKRSVSSSFFRYILPLLTGVSVLILTENLTNKYQEIKVATPPTVLLTFIFMQNGYQNEIPQLSYVTYMDKLYFLSYFLAILQLANALVSVGKRNKINRISQKSFKISFTKLSRLLFSLSVIIGPFILFFTS